LVYLLIVISIFVPPLWFFTVPYILYLTITREKRREKYADDGMIWESGGLLGSGVVDIDRAVSLYRKSCNMGSAKGCFFLARMYQLGKGVPESRIDYDKYIEKSKELDPDVYRQLQDVIDESDAEADRLLQDEIESEKQQADEFLSSLVGLTQHRYQTRHRI
jgi:TPR repeat protein